MEHHKISKLLNDSTVSKFVTRKWIEVNDLSGGQYSVKESITFKTSMLRQCLRDYSGGYIVVKGLITLEGRDKNKSANKNLIFKIMLHLGHAYQKSITHLLTMQKILILSCQCIIC